jgi:VanZ family protein
MPTWLIYRYRAIARVLTWVGASTIIILSVVPASDRPVTGGGQLFEHLTAFGLVAAMFAIAFQLSLVRRLFVAFVFCGSVELLQAPLPTRHARVSDFVIDLIASWVAIAFVHGGEMLIRVRTRKGGAKEK